MVGDTLKGAVSGVFVTISSIESNSCRYQISAISRLNQGWNDQTGFLNEEMQVISDNDYYQNLSYSIKSTKTFEEMIGPVNRLVHPSGLKNFAETKIEAVASIGIGLSEFAADNVLDFIGLTDTSETPLRVDRVKFDLGWDNEVNNDRSNAIRFQSQTPSKRLTDYVEVKTNRVLLHDDVSSQFVDAENSRRETQYVDFDEITGRYTRGVLMVRNPFTDQVQFSEIIVLANNNDAFTLQKAIVSDNEVGYGEFTGIALQSSEYTMRYTPDDPETFDVDLKLLTNKILGGNEDDLDLGHTTLDGNDFLVPASTTQEVYRASNTNNKAVVVYAEIVGNDGVPYYYEFYAFRIGADTYAQEYGFAGTSQEGYSEGFAGSFGARIASNKLVVDYENTDSDQVIVNVRTVAYKDTPSGTPTYRFKRNSIPNGNERSLILQTTSSSGISTDTSIDVCSYDKNLFQAVRAVVYIQGTDFSAIHQVMMVNSDGSNYVTTYPFITEGEDLNPAAGIGSFGAETNGGDMVLKFYPDAGLNTQTVNFYSYNEAFYRFLDEVNYRNEPLTYGNYEENYFLERYIAPQGERSDVRRFTLKYQNTPIYEKTFEPDTTITEIGAGNLNLFTIKDHFFSLGEELYYEPDSSAPGIPFSAIQVQPTTYYPNGTTVGVSTSTLPDRVYCIKRPQQIPVGTYSTGCSEPQPICNHWFRYW